jgi:thiol-disulfide isomerase/thioredoxin
MLTVKSDLIVSYLQRIDKTLLMVGSETCPACIKLKPQLHDIQDQYPDITFVFMDGNKHEESSDYLDITHFPTLIYFEGEIEKKRMMGSDIKKIIKLWK